MLDIAIIGAGPYGLSIAAYFRHHGISFRIFGRPMDSWLRHMPENMLLKSDGFASNLYDPTETFTLARFCNNRRIPYEDSGLPVSLETFRAYGLAFRKQMVPECEDKLVVAVGRSVDGFRIVLDDGEIVRARKVILAVGITHFAYVPENLTGLPAEYLSHSFQHRDLTLFAGRNVVVIGGGSSATDIAGLLRDIGAEVQLVSRRSSLRFHTKPTGKPRSSWQRLRHPQSGLGPGLRSWFFATAPVAFHYLPESLRLAIVRKHLGPSGGWFTKDKVLGRVPLVLRHTLKAAEIRHGKVQLNLQGPNGATRTISADHIIAATGYRVDLKRLKFLSPEIISNLKMVDDTPVLSSAFEASVPGLYFVGIAAANSFGPLMRFAFGAGYAARRLTQVMLKSASPDSATVPVESVVSMAK